MKKNMTTMLVFIFLLIALASFAAAENITYVYKRTVTHDDIVRNVTIVPSEVNVTLPNTTWTLELINNDSRFKISVDDINVSDYPELDMLARPLNLDDQTYDGDVGSASNARYVAKYAYAFNITQLVDKQYTVTFNYSSISGVSSPKIFKCDFDFTTNTTSTSTCSELSSSTTGTNLISASATNFSSFFLVNDNPPASGGTSGGGGGGGGGGGLGGPTTIYVTPTPEGESVRVIRGDQLIVQFKGGEYRYTVDSVGHLKVQLKDLKSYLKYDINFGETKTLGLTSFFARDITIDMHVSNNFAVLTFKTVETPAFSFNLLPPRKTTPSAPPEEIVVQRPPATTVTRPTPAITPGAEAGMPEEIPVPESPIGVWTIILAIVFVIFLVGGVALYRAGLLGLEKPPTVTRTGLESSGLPETSSEASKPAPILKQKAEIKEKPKARPVEEKPKPVKQVKPVKLSYEQKLELEKYVFHAYSMGFKEAQVRKALIDKGWPEQNIDDLLKEIRLKR